MVAPAPTTPIPTLSKADKLRLRLLFSMGMSPLACELTSIHDHKKAHARSPTHQLFSLSTRSVHTY